MPLSRRERMNSQCNSKSAVLHAQRHRGTAQGPTDEVVSYRNRRAFS